MPLIISVGPGLAIIGKLLYLAVLFSEIIHFRSIEKHLTSFFNHNLDGIKQMKS